MRSARRAKTATRRGLRSWQSGGIASTKVFWTGPPAWERFNAPAELRNLLELAARYADEPLEKYRQFVEEYAAQVDEFPARIAAGEPLTIEGSIVLVGSKEIVQAYTDELNRLKSRLRDEVKVHAQGDRLEGRRSSGGRESGSAESTPASDDSWVGLPPSALTENDHILVWWLPDYDEAIRRGGG